MKIVTRTSVALAVLAASIYFAPHAAAQAPRQGYRPMYMAAHPDAQSRVSNRSTTQTAPEVVTAEPASQPIADQNSFLYEGADGTWDDSYGDWCGDGSCGIDACGSCRRGLFYFSADYLLIRPRLSQGVAEVRRTLITTPESSESMEKSVNYCFDYNSSFRVAMGYRLLDCGGDIQFSYWRLTGDAQVSDGPASLLDDQLVIAGQLKNNPGQGQFFSAWTGVTANIYDLDFAKCLSFGGPSGDCCDFSCCPRWDLRFLAGVRIGDVTRFNNNAVTDPNGDIDSTGAVSARFTGAGPRVGLQGRRYFGACGNLSVFAKGSQALLIGDYEMSRILREQTGTIPGEAITSAYDSFCRMIPVTDIEIGGTWQIAHYAFFSAGWMWQCWWDLGQAENVSGTSFGPLDSSNILGFDGLFIRGELLF